jgi:glycosyltransferase involved in cell wall biosynthesis
MNPKVSIVMPVLNGQRFIGEAIQSILAQTYHNYELIMIDDGSTDGTPGIVHSFASQLELQYVRHESPRGIAPSMNDGVRHATGDLIAFLDHDDGWLPDFLLTQVTYLQTHPEVGMVHSDFQTTDVTGSIVEESVAECRGRARPSGNVFHDLFLDSFIVGNSVLIRKECFDRLGIFDETLKWGDYHMWMRIARHYRVDYVPKVLTKYRQHFTQSTRSTFTSEADSDSVALQAIKKLLEQYPEIRQELGEKTIRRRMAMLYYDMAYAWFAKEEMRNARICAMRAIRLWPTHLKYLRMYLVCLLPPSQAKALRQTWRKLRTVVLHKRTDTERLDRVTNVG